MSTKVTSIRIAGIGGMGVLKSTQILSELLFRRGFDVKKAEVHGMSQRGGSICSDVRFGDKVWSPMIPAGETDILLLLQEDQLPLYEADCSSRTRILMPDRIDAARLKSRKSLNVAMLGLLSRELDIPVSHWLEVLREVLPGKLHEENEAAFHLGRESA